MEFDARRQIQKTLALIKPEAVAKGYEEEIMERIVDEGFTIVRWDKMHLPEEKVQMFYREHEGKEFFPKLVEYISSGPLIVLVLAKYNAVQAWRELIGPTDVELAKISNPRCLRALYGTNKTYNACHGSSDPESARREIKFFYPNINTDPILTNVEGNTYIQDRLQSYLIEGLTKLAKEKPENPIDWLARWILDNNPNKPMVETVEE
ncbi:hypothetical protein C9374_002398 [Naegleria lovaniensis]|uniref:Nucleoside diphosphate kinase-like domain-containing protein n=1 Tax=Naegleria lovaniensis TaxID=51637 RepID=A0AA88GUZ8_NAELO|nr:uncharacterized protein C9374_002398 [Naegleria lovaniensis]KAG2386654.1 hypothetical protein C9374_002398 [Naegleria lovaniensis]